MYFFCFGRCRVGGVGEGIPSQMLLRSQNLGKRYEQVKVNENKIR